jgi:hypothetical protein
MAVYVHPDVLQNGLDFLQANGTRLVVCSNNPATFADANGAAKLCEAVLAPADYSFANGDVSGRKIIVAAKSGLAVAVAGKALHICILDVVASKLLIKTETQPATGIDISGTLNIAAFDLEITDAVLV